MSIARESETEYRYLKDLFSKLPDSRPPKSIAAYVEGRRVLPPGTPFPGFWKNSRTPYGVEWMENMSPYSPVQIQAICKARKIGASTILENVLAYYMDCAPAPAMYATASEDLCNEFSISKLPHLIESLGFADKITAQAVSSKSRRTGMTPKKVEYIGGTLDVISSRSVAARRAHDKRVLLIDELDGTPPGVAGSEGSFAEILMAHTNSWAERRKITLFSSPTTFEASLIYQYYERGDMRRWVLPCVHCGENLELKMGNEDTKYGLRPIMKNDTLTEAVYICPRCGGEIHDYHKRQMYAEHPKCKEHPKRELQPAHWEPTRTTTDATYRSYQINSLAAPVGMITFTEIYRQKLKAEEGGAAATRSFINMYGGLPFKDEGTRPPLKTVLALRGNYHECTIPSDMIYYLTGGIDVQRGSEKDPANPPRIEFSVIGTGPGYRKWLIMHRAFIGSTLDAFEGAWENFYQWVLKTEMKFYRKDGVPFDVRLVLVDAGDSVDNRDVEIMKFCSRMNNFYPSKGDSMIKANSKKGEKPDLPMGLKRWRTSRIGPSNEMYYLISTWHYKKISELSPHIQIKLHQNCIKKYTLTFYYPILNSLKNPPFVVYLYHNECETTDLFRV
ncbi:hypothetical protein FACS1894109_17710 [Spirochaetia bacterium]|nr:hypothetical protein FACS1894109_17710 [Spirochaetia bacterium]